MQLGLVSLKETLAKPRTQTMTAPRLYYRQLVLSWGKLCAKAWDEVQWHGMIHPYALARQSEKNKTTKEKSQEINKIHYTKNQIYTKFVRKNKMQKRTNQSCRRKSGAKLVYNLLSHHHTENYSRLQITETFKRN